MVFRKILDRKSGRSLFKRFNGKIVKVTNYVYITENGKVIRKNHITLKPKFKSAHCSGLGKKTPAASTPRKLLHQCSSSGTNRPVHILPRPDVSPVSTSTENSDTENKEGPFATLDRLQAKTMTLCSSLTKIAKKESTNFSIQKHSIAKRTTRSSKRWNNRSNYVIKQFSRAKGAGGTTSS